MSGSQLPNIVDHKYLKLSTNIASEYAIKIERGAHAS